MARGEDGYVVARLSKIEKADPAAAQKEVATIAENAGRALQDEILAQLADGLQADHPVMVDNGAVGRLFADQN
jgi:hypothetical protein